MTRKGDGEKTKRTGQTTETRSNYKLMRKLIDMFLMCAIMNFKNIYKYTSAQSHGKGRRWRKDKERRENMQTRSNYKLKIKLI